MDQQEADSPVVIPDIVVGRLPLYLRALLTMAQAGRQVTSSQELGDHLGLTAAQIRKDLSQFGEFGKQGTGYHIEFLTASIRKILHVDHDWIVALVGAGDLGGALARYQGFADRGFRLKTVFDSDPARIGSQIGKITVLDSARIEEIIRQEQIQIAMIAVPASEAQGVAERLVKAGIKAILNYAPVRLAVTPGIQVQNIDPTLFLQRMTYYLP